MTNDRKTIAELLKTPANLRLSLERQEAFIATKYMVKHPCPSCGTPQSVLDLNHASPNTAIADTSLYEEHGPCVKCGRPLVYCIPFMGSEFWRIDHDAEGK